ncbi:tetratricopeptide repeat protein [uncultured Cohaesibacter sp.]|uniref:tetratricopeptide repeat protein n=1 Tax=uncultured Cohaesibacter sp. TaxID=1002546 RepID=UPI00292D1588|nr:tetratricopeptide repeat protein [uncultured Cohaesibacter sp.]
MIENFQGSSALSRPPKRTDVRRSAFFAMLLSLCVFTLPSFAQSQDASEPQTQGTASEKGKQTDRAAQTGDINQPIVNPDHPFLQTPQFTLQPSSAYAAYQRGFYLTAFALATKLAGMGEVSAQTLLGELYLKGQGVPQDYKAAREWFQLAAEKDDREAQFNLAMLYARGDGIQKDLGKAIDLFEKASASGQKNAQFNLGLLYLNGQVVKQDLTKALDLISKSAKQGLAEAQYTLANLYRSDFFPAPNLEQASYWMQQAAKNGFIDAQLEFGLMLFQGEGVKRSYSAAQAWLKQAADAGSVLAQNRLARVLARGYGAAPQPVEAAKYYLLSTRAGKRDDWLENFFQKLSDEDKKKALQALGQYSLW